MRNLQFLEIGLCTVIKFCAEKILCATWVEQAIVNLLKFVDIGIQCQKFYIYTTTVFAHITIFWRWCTKSADLHIFLQTWNKKEYYFINNVIFLNIIVNKKRILGVDGGFYNMPARWHTSEKKSQGKLGFQFFSPISSCAFFLKRSWSIMKECLWEHTNTRTMRHYVQLKYTNNVSLGASKEEVCSA